MLRDCNFIMFRYVLSVMILLLLLIVLIWFIYYHHSPKDLIIAGVFGKFFLLLHELIFD